MNIDKVNCFHQSKEFKFLSNMEVCEIHDRYKLMYPSNENFYQAIKLDPCSQPAKAMPWYKEVTSKINPQLQQQYHIASVDQISFLFHEIKTSDPNSDFKKNMEGRLIKEFRRIFTVVSPLKSKEIGKNCPLQRGWNQEHLNGKTLKECVMEEGLRQKFSLKNAVLLDKLIKTDGIQLEEGNWWGDKFWGVAYKNKEDAFQGINSLGGSNLLGLSLMKIRDEAKAVRNIS